MKLIKSLKPLDYINLGSILVTLVGLIVLIVGGAVLSQPEGVGINTNLSPAMFVGVALIVVALAASIVGSAFTEKYRLNKAISAVALYFAVVALMFAIVFFVLTIVMPVLNPANG